MTPMPDSNPVPRPLDAGAPQAQAPLGSVTTVKDASQFDPQKPTPPEFLGNPDAPLRPVVKAAPNYPLRTGLVLLSLLALMMVLSFFWTPHDPFQTASDAASQLQPPSLEHPFGTDHLGRDVLSRAMIASQTVALVGFVALFISGFLGVSLGLLAGYRGGTWDLIIMRIVEVFTTIPGTILLLLFIAVFGRGTTQTVLAISIMSFTTFTRMTRSRVLSLRQQEMILWAQVVGASHRRIVLHHILPEILPMILVIGANQFSSAVMAEAGLSYLGLGVQPPQPSWGNMLTRAQVSLLANPWNAIIPGLLITVLVIGSNLLADGLARRYNLKVR